MQEYQESRDPYKNFPQGRFRNFEENRARKRFGFGVVILVIGLIVLARQLGFETLFPIRDIWPYVLIVVGLVIGLNNKFRSPAPFVLIIVGAVHAIPSFHFTVGDTIVYSRKLVAPLILIIAGLYFLLVSRKKKSFHSGPITNDQNFIMKDVIFGGSKEIVTSKNFEGGDVSAIFGGAEINLTQADTSKETVVMNVRAVFGGCEIIVPSHWDVKNEVFVALGSVDDQRTLRIPDTNTPRKTLVLKGMCMFGGIEVKSF